MSSSDRFLTEDLADLYDNAPCGYVSLSPDGLVVKANLTLTTWLGTSEDELVGKPFRDLLSFGGKIAFETHLAPLLRLQHSVQEIALDMIDGTGEKIPVIANAKERLDEDGVHRFTRLTLFKAVDRRKFERSLMDAKGKAEAESEQQKQDARLREQFIAVLGHDLRNPLGAIGAGVRILQQPDTDDGKATMVLKEMAASVHRADRLISDVMDFARGRLGGGLSLSFETGCDLRSLLDQIAGEAQATHPDRSIKVEAEISEQVDCDQSRIGQLVSNLLGNALTHGASDQPVILRASIEDEQLKIDVINGGPAIPDVTRARLFEPFVRGDTRENRSGLGLGLFIVNEIAKAHGGGMSVASTDEQTVFTLTMPRRNEGTAISAYS